MVIAAVCREKCALADESFCEPAVVGLCGQFRSPHARNSMESIVYTVFHGAIVMYLPLCVCSACMLSPPRMRPHLPCAVVIPSGQAEYSVRGEVRPCPYAGARFNVTLQFPESYPFKHPELVFERGTLYHPNVSQEDGKVCENLLSKSWGPTKKVGDILSLIQEFLANPNFGAFAVSVLAPHQHRPSRRDGAVVLTVARRGCC